MEPQSDRFYRNRDGHPKGCDGLGCGHIAIYEADWDCLILMRERNDPQAEYLGGCSVCGLGPCKSAEAAARRDEQMRQQGWIETSPGVWHRR